MLWHSSIYGAKEYAEDNVNNQQDGIYRQNCQWIPVEEKNTQG